MSKFSSKNHTPRTLRDARIYLKKNSKAYRESITDAIEAQDLTSKRQKKFEALLGLRPYAGKLLASDMEAKAEMGRQLISLVASHHQQFPKQRFFFLTMLSDEFRASKKEPVLWLKRLVRKSDKTIRLLCDEHGLIGGIGIVEPVFVLNPPDKREGEYPFHVHALLWAGEDFDLKAAKGTLGEQSHWVSTLGLDPIRIKELTEARGHPSWWAYYLSKNPVDAVNMVEQPNGSFKVRKTLEGYRPDAKLRLLEGLSQSYLQDFIFAVKDGKFIRDPLMRRTREARKLAHPDQKRVDVSKRATWFRSLWKDSRAEHDKRWQTFN